MRHAKSDWSDSSLSDFDRPLNKRGKKTAPFMGQVISERNKTPDLIISSPANRAKTTAKTVAENCDYKGEIQFERDFYFGYVDEIIEIVKKADQKHDVIMVVGHNPTLESLVSVLTDDNTYESMPTAALASINFNIDDWSKLRKDSGKLEWLLIPKELMRG